MKNITIQQAYGQAGEHIKELLFSPELDETINEMARKYGLGEQGEVYLEQSVRVLLLGIIDSSEFMSYFSNLADVDSTKAENVKADVRNLILAPLREYEKTPSQAQPKFNLPQEVSGTLSSEQVAQAAERIGRKYSLHVDKIGLLMDKTRAVLSGEIYVRDFISQLQQSLGVSEAQARMIADDTNVEIFSKVRDALRKMQEAPAGQREKTLREIEDHAQDKKPADPYREPTE